MLIFSKRIIKKSLTLFVIFFIISLIFLVVFNFIESMRDSLIKNNALFSNKFIRFQLQNINSDFTGTNLFKIISSEDGIVLGRGITIERDDKSNFEGTEIYFNKNTYNKPPILNGRFFEQNDFEKDTHLVVIGKGLTDLLISKENKRYLIYNNIYYEVIGIIGYKNKSSVYDDSFFMNLSQASLNNEKNLGSVIWKFDNINMNQDNSLNNIYKKLSKIDSRIQISKVDNSNVFNPLRESLKINKSIIIIFIILLLVIFLDIINFSLQWAYSYKKEIGVRKAYGGTTTNIIIRFVKSYQIISIVACIIAILVYTILDKYTSVIADLNFFNISTHIDFISTITLIIFSLIVGLVVAVIPMKLILRIEANEIIKGR